MDRDEMGKDTLSGSMCERKARPHMTKGGCHDLDDCCNTEMCRGGNNMKKIFLGPLFLMLTMVVPMPTMAGVDVNFSIGLPPPVVFAAPPELIVLPDTYVYVAPETDVDLFFWSGWWWRLWEGRWYRSHYYNRGWRYYNHVPSFYFDVDPGWRGYYRDHNWYGHRWDYERIPHQRVQQNWKGWEKNRHWEKQQTWGVQGYQPRLQQQRQELRQQRQPQVQQHQQQQQQRQHPQHSQSQGKPERGAEKKQDRK
jgi:hypothetical protein